VRSGVAGSCHGGAGVSLRERAQKVNRRALVWNYCLDNFGAVSLNEEDADGPDAVSFTPVAMDAAIDATTVVRLTVALRVA
jgi:hypothetical protein